MLDGGRRDSTASLYASSALVQSQQLSGKASQPHKKKALTVYREQQNNETESDSDQEHQMTPIRRGGNSVINRVESQQTRWKRQVEEQRRNIYDRHNMLN